MAKREPVRIPFDFEQAISELIKVKPLKPEKRAKAKKPTAKRKKNG